MLRGVGDDCGGGRLAPDALFSSQAVVFEHGGYRWRCQCGKQGAQALATEKLAEKAHLGHYKRVTKD
jgi:hypothetical protein